MTAMQNNQESKYFFRRARALSLFIVDNEIVIYNFISNRSFSCNLVCLDFLTNCSEWKPIYKIYEFFTDRYTTSISEELLLLFQLTALVVKGDAVADLDEEYENQWEWGGVSALLHFSSKDNPTVSDLIATEVQCLRAKHEPSPPLFSEHKSALKQVNLPTFDLSDNLFKLMRKRRTIRSFQSQPISIKMISDILYSGLGITGLVETATGILPLKMTPSPGARNPYEGYIYVNNIENLPSGQFFHYSATEHSLLAIHTDTKDNAPTMSQMFAENQTWVSKAAALVILVAHFERVMWKYINGNAYGSVLIECGHIAQNMMLCATKYKLVANPAGAIAHSLIERAIGLKKISHSVVYVLAVGYPDYSDHNISWLSDELEYHQSD